MNPTTEEPFVFPAPPAADVEEWSGDPIGVSNVITRTKTRTAVHNKALDETPARRDDLIETARRQAAASDRLYQHDVVIHGLKARAITNRAHLYDYWVDNWFSLAEWQERTGLALAGEPDITVYALGGVAGEEEAAYYSRDKNTIVFFNTSYYGQLKSWTLGAVGRILAADHGIHSIHGACIEREGRGVLYIAPTGTGKSTSSYGLMGLPETRFHSDDWVYVLYCYRHRDGDWVQPLTVTPASGAPVKGYRIYRWLDAHTDDRTAVLRGRTLDDRLVSFPLAELDRGTEPRGFAYTSEKVFYLRSNLVENFPGIAFDMLQSKFENCPEVTERFLREQARILDDLEAGALDDPDPSHAEHFRLLDPGARRRLLARMYAFDNTRAMLDIVPVFGADKVFTNPLEPVELSRIILLQRSPEREEVVARLPRPKFIERLLLGITPEQKREIAYNAYRAVDDEREKVFIKGLEAEAKAGGASLYDAYTAHTGRDLPETLYEEFELFHMMHRVCACYEMNTILQRDPQVKTKRQAVERTMGLLDLLTAAEPPTISLTLQNYAQHLPQAVAGAR